MIFHGEKEHPKFFVEYLKNESKQNYKLNKKIISNASFGEILVGH